MSQIETPSAAPSTWRDQGFPDPDHAPGGLLRLTTAGNVDDGKSTLIGRLLYDTRSIFADQLEAVARLSDPTEAGAMNLALLTDGLRAEREQKITIDVAYRYFSTPRRKFIIADSPGHLQYTRNMVTGASLSDLAIVLVDARKGVQTQSKRHAFLASLLRIPHLVVAINKMDLVEYSEERYRRIVAEFEEFARRIPGSAPVFIPISALAGDNVVERSPRTSWYSGPTLLEHLEEVDLAVHASAEPFRLPVQYVIRPHQGFRGFAGRIAAGAVRPGDRVRTLPAGLTTRVRTVEMASGPLEEAIAGESIVLTLADEVDLSRGEMLVSAAEPPQVATSFEALVCWMSDEPLDPKLSYRLMHTSRQVSARVTRLLHRIDIDSVRELPAEGVELNEIVRLQISTAEPIFIEPYRRSVVLGSFILIHPHTHATVAAGMIEESGVEVRESSPDVVWEGWNIPRAEREERSGHHAAVLWFTGLSGAGKSTIARALERRLFQAGVQAFLLDGDQLRHGLCRDLGFTTVERQENIRRAGEVARLFFEAGAIVLATFISPHREDRERLRAFFPEDRFLEVHVDADLEICRSRDPKGLYRRAENGEIANFTGISAPYERPVAPEVRIDTTRESVDSAVEQLYAALLQRGLVPETEATDAG